MSLCLDISHRLVKCPQNVKIKIHQSRQRGSCWTLINTVSTFQTFYKTPTPCFETCLPKSSLLSHGSIKLYGKEIPEPRLTGLFGDDTEQWYKYSGRTVLVQPMTPTLEMIRKMVEVSDVCPRD